MSTTNNKRRRLKKTSENLNKLTNISKQELISEEIKENEELKEKEKEKEQCMFCWEFSSDENQIHKMKHIPLFVSNCSCNCDVHVVCFINWVKKTPTCPICREDLMFNDEIYNKYTLGPHYKIKLFFKKIIEWLDNLIKSILKFASMVFLVYMTISIISCIVNYGK